jgi:hypothetical protein
MKKLNIEHHCQHCGRLIVFDHKLRKWVSSQGVAGKSTWKCGNDPAFPVRAHTPGERDV